MNNTIDNSNNNVHSHAPSTMDAPIPVNQATSSDTVGVVDEKQTVPAAGAAMTQPAPAAVLEAENPEKPKEVAAGTPAEVANGDEGVQYPGGFKLALISIALCLAVFLVALVCSVYDRIEHICLNQKLSRIPRTKLSLPRPFHGSLTTSTPSRTWAGMVAHTF